MAGFSGATGVPLKQMQDAIAQSTADAVAKTNALILNDTTWTGLLAKLRAGLNNQNGRAIALFVCYSTTATSILTGGRVTSYMKGYVTMSGANSNLYDFFGGALSNGDMYAWRITASDSEPTISNFRRFVDYEQTTAFAHSYNYNNKGSTVNMTVTGPGFVFIGWSTAAYTIHYVSGSVAILVAGTLPSGAAVSFSGTTLSVTNPQTWSVPIYVMSRP